MATIKYKNGSNWVNAALAFYPVGAIYLSYTSVTPADLFGGTWSSITTGVLRAKASNSTASSDSFTIGANNLPAHRHLMCQGSANATGGNYSSIAYGQLNSLTNLAYYTKNTQTNDGKDVENASISRLPQYQNVYAYRRTA